MRTIASGITLGYAATTLPSVDPTWSGFLAEDERITWRAVFPGGPMRLDKLVRIGTSRDVDGGPVKEGCLDGSPRPGPRASTRSSPPAPRRGKSALGRLRRHDRRRPGEHTGHAVSASTTC
jgi:hypothetical protein